MRETGRHALPAFSKCKSGVPFCELQAGIRNLATRLRETPCRLRRLCGI